MSADSELRRERPVRKRRSDQGAQQNERALEELREVLTRPALDRMERIERKLAAGGVDAAAVASHLPRAAAMVQGNQEFSRALAPTVEEAIQVSVRRNPQPLVDAIFPIIGPAIRRSIQTALAGMTDGLNSSLESSFKLKGLRRLIKAKRTGRSVGEIALLESLVYRVEQVLWIENETGLLLANVSDPGLMTRDPDLVSSMLAALQDYVGDSFGESSDLERTQLQEIEFGEQQLAIFRGPRSSLAALVRGRASSEWRVSAEELLERLHLSASEELAGFDGNVDPFQSWTGELETVLDEKERERKQSYTTQILLAAVCALLIFFAVREFNLRRQVRSSWSAVVERYENEPGILVLNREQDGELLELDLLRDPLARSDEELLAGLSSDDRNRVLARDISFQSTDPVLSLRRAQSVLEPPSSVNLTIVGSRLVVSGEASHEWIQRARQRTLSIQGLDSFDRGDLIDRDLVALEASLGQLRRVSLAASGTANETGMIERLRERLRALEGLAANAGALVRVSIVGEAQEAGDLAGALALSEAARVFVSPVEVPSAEGLVLQAERTLLDSELQAAEPR